MTLGGVTPGDIVLADRKGRRFYALVAERRDRELEVEPIDRRVTYRHVKAREVIGISRKSRARNARARNGAVKSEASLGSFKDALAHARPTLRAARDARAGGAAAVNAAGVNAAKPIGRPAELALD